MSVWIISGSGSIYFLIIFNQTFLSWANQRDVVVCMLSWIFSVSISADAPAAFNSFYSSLDVEKLSASRKPKCNRCSSWYCFLLFPYIYSTVANSAFLPSNIVWHILKSFIFCLLYSGFENFMGRFVQVRLLRGEVWRPLLSQYSQGTLLLHITTVHSPPPFNCTMYSRVIKYFTETKTICCLPRCGKL